MKSRLFRDLKERAQYGFTGSSLIFDPVTGLTIGGSNKDFYAENFFFGKPITTVNFCPLYTSIKALRDCSSSLINGMNRTPLLLIVKLENYRNRISPSAEFDPEIGNYEVKIEGPIRKSDIIVADERVLRQIEKYLTFLDGQALGLPRVPIEKVKRALIERLCLSRN